MHKILTKIFKESCNSKVFMIKKIFIFSIFLLSSCAPPGTALIGPIFTGAKTGSIYQTSLSYSTSYGTNRIIEKVKFKDNSKVINKKNLILPDIPYSDKDPIILLSYKVNKIDISEVYEPEPLP